MDFLKKGIPWQDVVVQGLKIDSLDKMQLLGCNFNGSTFLGCRVDEKVKSRILETGGLYFPEIDGLPYQPYRGKLYDREELYDNFDPNSFDSYKETKDWKIYDHYQKNGKDNPTSILESLSQRLHDHSITDALTDFLEQLKDQNRVVAIMGGHELARNSSDYKKAALISYRLSRAGYLMISGGGPGAMEATHLGVWLSGYEENTLDDAINSLSQAPTYQDKRWLTTAYEVIRKYPFQAYAEGQGESIGIPTWLYGHEPATPFASKIAKYFANIVRGIFLCLTPKILSF